MEKTIYLSEANIIRINENIIKKYSPKETIGVKELGSLQATLAMLTQTIFGEEAYPTIYDKAAILMIQLATKHIFHNANKRTAVAATDLFLKLNGYEGDWEYSEYLDFVMNTVLVGQDPEKGFDELKRYVTVELKRVYH